MDNQEKKKINLSEIYPDIKNSIDNDGIVRLPITGTSMLPLLLHDRDTVDLVKCENPKKGDIIFYRRDNGQFVLHRIIGTDENGYVLCGDNQWFKEKGIKDHNIIAVVSFITRRGKTFSVKSIPYRIYSSFWMFVRPIRKYLLYFPRKTKTILKKILVKLKIMK